MLLLGDNTYRIRQFSKFLHFAKNSAKKKKNISIAVMRLNCPVGILNWSYILARAHFKITENKQTKQ